LQEVAQKMASKFAGYFFSCTLYMTTVPQRFSQIETISVAILLFALSALRGEIRWIN